LYTGITNDFKKRYEKHILKQKTAAKYTKSRSVTGVEAVWKTDTRSSALKLESRIKKLTKAKKESIISNPELILGLKLEDKYIYSLSEVIQFLEN